MMDAIQEKFGEHALRKGFWLEEEKRKEMEEEEKENSAGKENTEATGHCIFKKVFHKSCFCLIMQGCYRPVAKFIIMNRFIMKTVMRLA